MKFQCKQYHSKNKFYKHNQINKASVFIIFCSFLFLFSYSVSFLHIILINSTIYFHVVAKRFDLSLCGRYDESWFKIALKVLDNFSCLQKDQTT